MNWNRYFSLSRFVWVLRRDFVENWKYNPRVLFTSFFMISLIYVMTMNAFSRISFSDNDLSSYIDFQKAVILLGFSIQLLGMASHFMMHMKTKEARISNLMLPATSLEKFLARFLFVTIGCTVLFVIAALLAEAVRFAIMPFFSGLPDELKIFMFPELFKGVSMMESIYADTQALKILTQMQTNDVLVLAFMSILCSCLHAIYVLGGNLLGKNAFLITTLVVVLFGYVGNKICLSINFGGTIDFETFEWIEVVCLCLNVFIYYLSYRVFSRQQVIKPKFRLW